MADRWGARSARGRIYTQVAGLLLASPFLFLLGYADTRLLLLAALAGALKGVLGLAAAFQIAAGILCLSGLLLLRIELRLSDSFHGGHGKLK